MKLTDEFITDLFEKLNPDELNRAIINSDQWQNMGAAEKVFRMFSVLLIQSERRIDQTNKMVFEQTNTVRKMEDCIKHLTLTYEKHIENITHSRDLIMKENARLHEEMVRLESSKNKMQEEYIRLIEKILLRNTSENNFNIHK